MASALPSVSYMHRQLMLLASASIVAVAASARADPTTPNATCIAISMNECVPGETKTYLVQFEVLNWSPAPALGLRLYLNDATSDPTMRIAAAGVDEEGAYGCPEAQVPRVGMPGFDDEPHHRGIPQGSLGVLNRWLPTHTETSASFWGADPGDVIPNRDPGTNCLGRDNFAERNPYLDGIGCSFLGSTTTNDGGPRGWMPDEQLCG